MGGSQSIRNGRKQSYRPTIGVVSGPGDRRGRSGTLSDGCGSAPATPAALVLKIYFQRHGIRQGVQLPL